MTPDQWIAQHQVLLMWIAGVLGSLSTLASIVQGMLGDDGLKAHPRWAFVLLWVAFLAPKGHDGLVGRFSPPLLHVPSPTEKTPSPTEKDDDHAA